MNMDPISPYWPLIYTTAGAVFAIGGQIISDWLQSNRDFKQHHRDIRREQLYLLQDQIFMIFDLTRQKVADASNPFKVADIFADDSNVIKDAIFRLSGYSLRVGDDPLSKHIDEVVRDLYYASNHPTDASKRIVEAHRHLKEAQIRIGELLHTDIEVELGIGNRRRWNPFSKDNDSAKP